MEFDEVIKGRVCALRLSPLHATRIYLLAVHNFDLKEEVRTVAAAQASLARWVRAVQGKPGVGLIGGDFNFSLAGAARWRVEGGGGGRRSLPYQSRIQSHALGKCGSPSHHASSTLPGTTNLRTLRQHSTTSGSKPLLAASVWAPLRCSITHT